MRGIFRINSVLLAAAAMLIGSGSALADGRVVDKVYHPYVQPLEREFEYRFAFQKQADHPDNNNIAQKSVTGFRLLSGWRWKCM